MDPALRHLEQAAKSLTVKILSPTVRFSLRETFLVESWTEHSRQHERATNADPSCKTPFIDFSRNGRLSSRTLLLLAQAKRWANSERWDWYRVQCSEDTQDDLPGNLPFPAQLQRDCRLGKRHFLLHPDGDRAGNHQGGELSQAFGG